jgi:16S rRNA C967 or C1407 C5-methylase (RsmB/RsmF family)/NOL1/NOP2/fmu family ribosome biogenesis protein
MNETFRKYLEEAIGAENALVAFSAFERPASVSVRLNPFKKGAAHEGVPVAWSGHGIMLQERPSFTLDPLFHAGAYYVQDSSSMFVGHVFRQILASVERPSTRPLRVLDLCAAPGGKTTDLAASLREACGDDFILVANEVMKARVGILADNVALWGDPNVVVTSDDPRAFAPLAGYFDIILADVPCSGEGMFRKDEQAIEQWSADNVALCEARQRRIIADVWPSLNTGGVLVYSTCTFNRYENDANVKWIAENLGADILPKDYEAEGVIRTECGYSLVPGFVEGEGQYCCALRKTSDIDTGHMVQSMRRSKATPKAGTSFNPEELKRWFDVDVIFRQRGETIIALPQVIAADVQILESFLHVIAAGCAVGVMKGQNLVPDADLALSIAMNPEVCPHVDIDRDTALAYLHRDAVCFPDAPKGYLLLRYEGLPLGFVKNLGNRCNSLLPQSRRIRMNIR